MIRIVAGKSNKKIGVNLRLRLLPERAVREGKKTLPERAVRERRIKKIGFQRRL